MADESAGTHPCLTCGACCSGLRVQFHRDHATPRGRVPRQLTAPTPTPDHVCMVGTGPPTRRCIALDGIVGDRVACTIYEQRPPPCRDFRASWADGAHHEPCDAARARHGLPPLTPADWAGVGAESDSADNS